jgi:hypothetical protein
MTFPLHPHHPRRHPRPHFDLSEAFVSVTAFAGVLMLLVAAAAMASVLAPWR